MLKMNNKKRGLNCYLLSGVLGQPLQPNKVKPTLEHNVSVYALPLGVFEISYVSKNKNKS